jgi:hypothetical protein
MRDAVAADRVVGRRPERGDPLARSLDLRRIVAGSSW